MFVALDENGNRVYADSSIRLFNCTCQGCGAAVAHKMCKHKTNYFSHKPSMTCKWNDDRDNKSEWHRKMQNFFPKVNQEVRFTDNNTGEIHIADIYDPQTNSVMEIQCSRITDEEFASRTEFHISNGRRIVWIFDESSGKEEYGRFRRMEETHDCLRHENYEWMRYPRKCIDSVKYDIEKDWNKYSVCVYTGKEEDLINRIYSKDKFSNDTTFSIHNIKMEIGMDVNDFFESEWNHWAEIEPWRTYKEQYLEQKRKKVEQDKREMNAMFQRFERAYMNRNRR